MSTTTTTTATQNQSPQNFSGTCTAKFMKDGNEVAPAFNGSSFQINYNTHFPKTIRHIQISDAIDNGRYFSFTFDPVLKDGTYLIPLNSSNAHLLYKFGFMVDEGELNITVDNGNCSGTFSFTATGQSGGGGEKETLNIVEGIFNIEGR